MVKLTSLSKKQQEIMDKLGPNEKNKIASFLHECSEYLDNGDEKRFNNLKAKIKELRNDETHHEDYGNVICILTQAYYKEFDFDKEQHDHADCICRRHK